MLNCVIWKYNLVALAASGFYFDDCKSGGLHEKHAVAA
jgi:hypothetical protein